MDIIQIVNGNPLPRAVRQTLVSHLESMPAVVLSGARQTGKSTLCRELFGEKRSYRTLDDLDVLDLAQSNPSALAAMPGLLTLDEVQREPSLLTAVKREIDRDRRLGKFVLTGSADLLLMESVSESLAGRASYLSMRPLTRREQLGKGTAGRWDELIRHPEDTWIDRLASDRLPDEWIPLARRGGFPTPSVELGDDAQRRIWFEGYTRTYLERDLRELSAVSSLPDFRRLMQATALRTGGLVNQTELGRDLNMPQPTVHRYLNLLETSLLIKRVPAYSVNRTKRLIKSPKLYWGDSGLALFLAGSPEPTGHSLENVVLQDLLVWRDVSQSRAEILHWRTTAGEEIDFVIESPEGLLPIEVRTATRATLADAKHIAAFRREYGSKSRPGVVLYAGAELAWLSADAIALPWWSVL